MVQHKPTISIIAAMARNTRVIGKEGRGVPWRIPEDWQHFKDLTMGHPIIMGRVTHKKFKGKLSGRTNIVVTRQKDFVTKDGIIVVNSIEEAIAYASTVDNQEIFIIGGGQIYEASLALADRLYLTIVDTDIDGPVKFPEYESLFTKVVSRRASKDENLSYEFVVLEK